MIQEEKDNLARVEAMREAGIDPYPSHVERTHMIEAVLEDYEKIEKSKKSVTIVGRIRLIRKHGGLTFCQLEDGSARMQLALKRDDIGEDVYKQFHAQFTVGDFAEITGVVFRTKTDERTVDVKSFKMLSKALLPLPEKFHGLADAEQRLRKRYLDMIMNPDVKEIIMKRSKIMSALRQVSEELEFIDVETPTLQPVYGGGFARPFVTHHNSLDADFFLRISDEMYLKRLIVGGFERVYEITKVFRNEGIDRDHNPEFTMFEAQAAYKDYNWGMDVFEELFEQTAKKALGTTEIKHDEVEISVARPWKRATMVESIKEVTKEDVLKWKDLADAKKNAEKLGVPKEELEKMTSVGEVISLTFEEKVEETLIQPTIIYDYPVEVSPLAKRKADDSRFAERFEAFVLGMEIGNNYSELNDPQDLEKRFIEEKKKEAAGFDEAHQTDYDYLEAIKHGFPPACGFGIGFDRMVMVLTGAKNIKEVIAFPTLRPTQQDEE